MEVYIPVQAVTLVIGLLDHVADYLIEKSCHGLAQDWLGEVKNQAGEELVVVSFQILQLDVALLILLISFSLVRSQYKLR